jgi:uncharacterized protein
MVDLQGQAVVAILTRAPSAGGKTRLFAEIGCAPDRELLGALLLDTLAAATASGIVRVVCYTPDDAEAELRALLPSDVMLLPQRGEDLGARMQHAFDDLVQQGTASIALIGSDLPALDTAVIVETHRVLRRRPETVVFGPSLDGGYYLIGATRAPARLFDDIPWSTSSVLAETERRARGAGWPIARVTPMADIDTLDDLRKLIRSTTPALHTRRAVTSLGVRYGAVLT